MLCDVKVIYVSYVNKFYFCKGASLLLSSRRQICSFAVLFPVSQPFFHFSLVYEGHFTLCFEEKLEQSDCAYYGKVLRGHRSAWFPLFVSACHLFEFVTSIIYHVLVYCFGSFLLQDIKRDKIKSPGICFWGIKYDVYCEHVAYLHSILWLHFWHHVSFCHKHQT